MKKTKISTIISSDFTPFVVLGLGMLIFHLTLPVPTGDDIDYSIKLPSGVPIWNIAIWRYLTWSSRLIIESFIVLFLRFPSIIWRIANSAVIVLLGVSISKLFVADKKREANWFIIILLFIFPWREISDAGWVTTTLNYLWPLSFGLYSLILVKKWVFQKKIRNYEYVLSMLALIYAVNNEILCVVLLGIYFATSIYLLLIKRPLWFVYYGFVLCVVSTIFALISPGNAARRMVEHRWFLDFDHISIIDKLEIGVSSTLAHYFYEFNFVFLIFCLLLFISVFCKYKDKLFRIYSLIPLLVTVFFGILPNFMPKIFQSIFSFNFQMTKYGLITLENFTNIRSYIALILFYTTSFLVIMLLYLVFENTWQGLIAIGAILLGFISRMLLVISPTIWASGTRTYFFLSASIIICSVMIFQYLLVSSSKCNFEGQKRGMHTLPAE